MIDSAHRYAKNSSMSQQVHKGGLISPTTSPLPPPEGSSALDRQSGCFVLPVWNSSPIADRSLPFILSPKATAATMIHETEFVTDKKGVKIFRQWWLPDGEPKGVVIVCHGVSSVNRACVRHAIPLVQG